jgi:hypothetical protein
MPEVNYIVETAPSSWSMLAPAGFQARPYFL